ncbi:hypothetical protein [Gracilimonas tropica]|uniref:hypothetical protein n=1 Tax=Gracilimonas tropica TaxID=454600 RepID=UPI000362865A|nr:hypothetical protein [Gracilimonas tropica]
MDLSHKQKLYDIYKEERQRLDDAAREVGARYDKNTLLLAGGALVISITFIEKISPSPSGWSMWLIGVSWLLLIVSIICQLYAIGESQNSIRRQIEILDLEIKKNFNQIDEFDNTNKYIERTGTLNRVALWSFIIGVIFLCAFSIVNLNNTIMPEEENKKVERKRIDESKGSYVPPTNIVPPPQESDSQQNTTQTSDSDSSSQEK